MKFLYEDGQGHIFEPMDLVVDEELFATETTSSRTQFLANKPPERHSNPVMRLIDDVDMLYNKRSYTFYSDEDKTRFFSKCLNASAAVRQLGIHVRAAQRWAKRYYEDPEIRSVSYFGEEHEQFLLTYIDENRSTVVTEVAESSRQNFADLTVSRSTVYNIMTTERNLN
ncbi:uncharacterized protein BYT42DRAFT_594582 [Radiomyces spectabilis]|uniref:uncharacterized protein n=1 Tax=Radiomyces spectabilis TaxID=64574 RepID=UPI00221E9EBD|nr:uncharacterized protein BYT42DRAFT_594582 [Radiomyces spectabilis]KAI8374531.1 hypothetical protein BYT42DRAFT_594582 [Radiomyces spectabilis]